MRAAVRAAVRADVESLPCLPCLPYNQSLRAYWPAGRRSPDGMLPPHSAAVQTHGACQTRAVPRLSYARQGGATRIGLLVPLERSAFGPIGLLARQAANNGCRISWWSTEGATSAGGQQREPHQLVVNTGNHISWWSTQGTTWVGGKRSDVHTGGAGSFIRSAQ